jgi:hypothetical protein
VDALKKSTHFESVRGIIGRSSRVLLVCLIAVSSTYCVNDMVEVVPNYGNGGGSGSRPSTPPLGRDPDTMHTFVRQLGAPQPAAPDATPEKRPGLAPAN